MSLVITEEFKQTIESSKELIYKFESERLGCFRTLFVGNYLFAACSSKKHTIIKVFSLDRG